MLDTIFRNGAFWCVMWQKCAAICLMCVSECDILLAFPLGLVLASRQGIIFTERSSMILSLSTQRLIAPLPWIALAVCLFA